MECELTDGAAEHGRCAALRFAVRASQSVHVHVHVSLRNGFERGTIPHEHVRRTFQDEARHSVPDGPSAFVFDGAFAHEICLREELAPPPFARANDRVSSFDERRWTRLREARSVAASIHDAIVLSLDACDQINGARFRQLESGHVICSTVMPCGVDSIHVACATVGRSRHGYDGAVSRPSGASPMLPTLMIWTLSIVR